MPASPGTLEMHLQNNSGRALQMPQMERPSALGSPTLGSQNRQERQAFFNPD